MSFFKTYSESAFVGRGGNKIQPARLRELVLAQPAITDVFEDFRILSFGSGADAPDTGLSSTRTWVFQFAGAGPNLAGGGQAALDAIVAAHDGTYSFPDTPNNGGALGEVWTHGASGPAWATSVAGVTAFAALTDGFALVGQSLKAVRVNAAGLALEPYTPAGGGNVSNAGSGTDNAVARFDSNGQTLQNSLLVISDTGAASGITTFACASITATGGVGASGAITGSNLSGTNTGDQTITLTGPITGSGTGSIATTITNDAVTYAKIQNVSAASCLLGRGSAGGAGDVEEITLGAGMAMTAGVLSSTGGAPGGTQGDLQLKGVSSFEGATGYMYDLATGLVVSSVEPISPSSVGWGMYADRWLRPAFTDPTRHGGFDVAFVRRMGFGATGGGSSTMRPLGGVSSASIYGTAAGSAYATTSARTAETVVTYTPAVTANTGCSGTYLLGATLRHGLSTDSSHGAFRVRFSAKFGITIASASNARFFAGLAETVTSFTANPTASASGMGTRMGIGFGDTNSGVLQWITTQAAEANSVVSTGITVTDGHMYYVEMFTLPMSALVVGTLWRQATAGGSWTIVASYEYDTTGNVLSASSIGLMVAGGNGATASSALTVHVGSAITEMR